MNASGGCVEYVEIPTTSLGPLGVSIMTNPSK